jgi:arylsulfatase A
MKKTTRLKTTGMTPHRILAVSALLLALTVIAPAGSAPAPRPNIVFILADDLGSGDLGCFGHREMQTPHLDALAAGGLKLTQCYSAAAVCSPARAGIMTGRTPYRVGVYNAIPFLSPAHLPPTEITIATLLKKAGYATAQVGKWHLNGYFNLPGQPQPDDHGFDHWFAVQNNALPNHHNPFNFVRNGIPQGPIEGYSGGIVAAEALRWLATGRDKSKPFFLYVALNEPHEPIATDPQFSTRYAKDYPDDPSRVAYYGNVTQMDDAVGKVLAALEAQGLAENTLVWFTSDNGPARTKYHNVGSAGSLRGYKGLMYEGGLRVPGIVRWPARIKAGTTSATPVSGVDVLPTLCEIAGIAAPSDRKLDGASVAPVFSGSAVRRNKPLYWQYAWAHAGPQTALRDGPWKVLARLDGPRPKGGEFNEAQMQLLKTAALTDFELYHLDRDPAEKQDLSRTEPAKLAELKSALVAMQQDVRSDGPVWPTFKDPGYEQRVIVWPKYVAKPLPQEK